MVKFIHAADLHIDSPLRGLEAYEGAPVERARGATRQAFRNLITLCLEQNAAFLLLSGDVFDQDWKDFNTGLFFKKQLLRLKDANIRVYMVRGNHDSANEVTRTLTLPDHVRVLSHDDVETVYIDDLGVALHGRSFAQRHVKEDLVPSFPGPVPSMVNIGMLHTSAAGSILHELYAPCTVHELAAKGYQYWALGHVHARTELSTDPWIVFPGNAQGRDIQETGAKGCTVVTVGSGEIMSVDHVPVDVLRWLPLDIVLDEDDDMDAMLGRATGLLRDAVAQAEQRLLAVRLTVTGACRAHEALALRREAAIAELRSLDLDDIWLEDIRIKTRPLVDLAELRASDSLVGQLLRSVETLRTVPAELASVATELKPLYDKVGAELIGGGDPLDNTELVETLSGVEGLLALLLTKVPQ
jgi:exonuclease SbcD